MENLWELIINILEASVFYFLLNIKLEKKVIKHSYFKQTVMLLAQSVFLYLLNRLHISPLPVIFIMTFFSYIWAAVFFSSPNSLKLFWTIVYAISTMTADALTTIIPTKLFHYQIQDLLVDGSVRIPFTLVYIALLAMIIIIFVCFTTKTFQISTAGKFVFIILSIICISIEELILLEQINITNGKIDNLLMCVIFFLVMILFISLIFYIYSLGVEKDKNIKMIELHTISEMENKQYSQIIQSVSELRVMKHDLSNHLKTIQTMLEKEHFTDAQKYVSSLSGMFEHSYYTISSGNTPVDCIVTNKLQQADSADISVDYTIHLPEKFPLSDIESCSLIGNLFDNAIESCRQLEKEQRHITFSIKPYHNMLSIQMTNSSNGIYKTLKNGLLTTTKSDKESHSHGIGLKRINDIVSKYQGFLEITPEKDSFHIAILIPLDETANKTVNTVNGGKK